MWSLILYEKIQYIMANSFGMIQFDIVNTSAKNCSLQSPKITLKISNFFKILQLLDMDVRRQYLVKVSDFLTIDNQCNWRFRVGLAELVCYLFFFKFILLVAIFTFSFLLFFFTYPI